MPVTGTVMPAPKYTAYDSNGSPLSSGLLEVYEAGTVSPATTFADAELTIPNTNPIILDAAGRATVYLAPGFYKFIQRTSVALGATIVWSQDNVSSIAPFNVDLDIAGIAGEHIHAGAVCYLSTGDGSLVAGRWYLADADLVYASSGAKIIAFAPNAITAGSLGAFRLQGRTVVPGPLVAGTSYYVSSVAGGFITPAPISPAFTRLVGIADTTTSIVSATGFGDSPSFGGSVSIGGSLTVSGGITTTGSLSVAGGAVIQANLEVVGNITTNGNLAIGGVITSGSISSGFGSINIGTDQLTCGSIICSAPVGGGVAVFNAATNNAVWCSFANNVTTAYFGVNDSVGAGFPGAGNNATVLFGNSAAGVSIASAGAIRLMLGSTTYATLGTTGLMTFSGFGTHTFSGDGTGANVLVVKNPTSGIGNYAYFQSEAGTTLNRMFAFSQTYNSAAVWDVQASGGLVSYGVGGLSLAAIDGAGIVRVYGKGAVQRMQVAAGVTVGDTTDPGNTNFRVAGTTKLVSNVAVGTAAIMATNLINAEWDSGAGGGFCAAFGSIGTNPQGISVGYAVAINDANHPFLYCYGSAGAVRAAIRSDGGFANFSANNVNLSDATVKTITGDVGSERARFRQLRLVRGRYHDTWRDHDDVMLTAQEVETIYPELVEWFDEKAQLKGVREQGLMMRAFRVIQELDDEVTALRALMENHGPS